MQGRAQIIQLFRRSALPALCLLLIGYFLSHAVTGPTGILAWQDYKAERAALEKQALASAEAKAALARQVALLDPRKVDPDLADELVRKNLNVAKPDEIIVQLPQEQPPQ